jgi:hypothetical protein
MSRVMYPKGMTPPPHARTQGEIDHDRRLRTIQYDAQQRRKNGEEPEPIPNPLVRGGKKATATASKAPKPPKQAKAPPAPPPAPSAAPAPDRKPAKTEAGTVKRHRMKPAPAAAATPTPPNPPPPEDPPQTTAPPPPATPPPTVKPKPKKEPAPAPTELANPLRAAEQSFYLDRELRECTPRTMEHYHHHVGRLVAWLENHGVTEPTAIKTEELRAYLAYHKSRDICAQTLHHYANCARIFCNFLLREEILVRSPMARVAMPRIPKKILPAFTVEEIKLLVDESTRSTLPERDKAMVLTLLDSGCRASEFMALNVEDLDRKTGALIVHQGKGRK